MKQKKLIAFDLYDTCIHHPHRSSEYRNILSSWVSQETIEQIRELLQIQPVNIDDLWLDIPENLIKDFKNLDNKNIENTKIYPDTLDTLIALKERWYKLALISNLAQNYEKPLRNLIPSDIFDYEALSYKIWEIKPNPWIFNHIKNESWIDYKDMVMVWDSKKSDVNWALNVWMDAIQVDRKLAPWNIVYEKDYIRISTLSELMKLFS